MEDVGRGVCCNGAHHPEKGPKRLTAAPLYDPLAKKNKQNPIWSEDFGHNPQRASAASTDAEPGGPSLGVAAGTASTRRSAQVQGLMGSGQTSTSVCQVRAGQELGPTDSEAGAARSY